MEQTPHKYVTVAYELYTDNEKGIHELVEKAPAEHPFQFITGMGVALDAFEAKINELKAGEAFDFVLKVDDAYGPYEEEHVLELDKQIFSVNGHFDKEMVYPGAVLPLVNSDGNRFQGLVLEVKDNTVVVDLNHPLAGKDLHFKGEVVVMRDATDDEIKGLINMMSGEGCGCGCEDCGGEGEGGCCGGHGEGHGHGHGEGGCCGGHGEGHGHGHGEGGCCGGHGEGHGHGHGEGGCCGGHGKGHGHGHGEGCCQNKD
ncbi:MAG: FKBP-type peptidyl-prolyl cis-trans isomerase [Prevotellamassilia sp.]|nr:FKBP-type peptidyl-prolyl cis-trans isomerase [Prevotellamassilia sp.]